MSKISVILMGSPIVNLDQEPVHFAYRKMESFFYYLCLKKRLTREEVVGIFWADNDEKTARKNLRNVIYRIKKLIGEDSIHTIGNSVIELNRSLVNVDVDYINTNNIVNLYAGEFLHYFFVKDCYEFDVWCDGVRLHYRELYLSELYLYLCSVTSQKNFQNITEHAKILIQNAIYDERLYREIMRIYSENGHYNLAIKLYYELKELIDRDLGIEPEEETEIFLSKILSLKEVQSNQPGSVKEYFFGRYEELLQLSSSLNEFLTTKSASILVSGEAGVGKTVFLKKIVEQINPEDVVLIQYICHASEKDFYLKSWYNILKKMEIALGDLVGQGIEKSIDSQKFISLLIDYSHNVSSASPDQALNLNAIAISDALIQLTELKKVILVIDDVQWLDSASLKLLNTFLLKFGGSRFLVIAAYRENYQELLRSFSVTLEKENLLKSVYLNRFSLDDVNHIVKDLIPAYQNDTQLIRKIYQDTEGNGLFLIELIKIIEDKGYSTLLSSKAVNIIKSRLVDLSEAEQGVANALSLFPNQASMEDLKIFYPIAELEIFEILEKLMDKKIVKEKVKDGNVFYCFDHQKIQEYIKERQSKGKRKAINEKIAQYYEKEYKVTGNKNLYPRLSYHFGESENTYKTCYYKVQYLNDYYYSYHEIYPHIYSHMLAEIGTNDDTYQDEAVGLEELAKEVEKLTNDSEEYKTLKIHLYFVMGRYYFYSGNYKRGLEKNEESLRIAIEQENFLYIYNNYKQRIYYGIQISDLNMMKRYLNLCDDLLCKIPNQTQETSAVLRLKGLYLIEIKQYDKAQEVLMENIKLLFNNKGKESYLSDSIDVAVCYNYLGRSYMLQKKYEIAYEHFLKAIALCDQQYITNGVGIFYADAAQVLYKMKRYVEALDYIQQANYYFSKTQALWGGVEAQIYAILIEIELGNIASAKEYFETAQSMCEKLSNPKITQRLENIKQQHINYLIN